MIIRRRTRRLALHEKSTIVTYDGSRETTRPQMVNGLHLVETRLEPANEALEKQVAASEIAASSTQIAAPRPGATLWLRRMLAFSGRGLRLLLLLLAVCSIWASAPAAAQTPVQTFYVNSTNDTVDQAPGDGKCSTGNFINGTMTPECTLRAAVDEVNALANGSGSSPTYAISVGPGTYMLTTAENCHYSEQAYGAYQNSSTARLCLNANVTISGANPATTIVDGGGAVGLFLTSVGYTVAISNLTMQNGNSNLGGGPQGGSYGAGSTGPIDNEYVMTLTNDIFLNNQGAQAGAVFNADILFVEGCTFTNNTAQNSQGQQSGGAIASLYSFSNTPVTSVDLSTFTGNQAGSGSAIEAGGQNGASVLHVSNSTFTKNVSSGSGTIDGNGTMSVVNSTFYQNTARIGILNGNMTLNDDTINQNTLTFGGYYGASTINGAFTLSNTIVADNSNGEDCPAINSTDLGYNLFGNAVNCSHNGGYGLVPAPTDLVGVEPMLSVLQVDGGTIATEIPLPGSPVINAGSPAVPGGNASGACAALDERGFLRVSGACSMGAANAPVRNGGLQVLNVLPDAGGAGGMTTVVFLGVNFAPGSTVVLKSGSTTLTPTQMQVASDTNSITGLFDLTLAAAGSYDVLVTTPAGTSTTLTGGFTIAAEVQPILSSFLVTPVALRAGRPASFSVTYNNMGNTDAYMVPLTVNFTRGYTAILPPVSTPPANPQQVQTDFSGVPLTLLPVAPQNFISVPLLIPVLPANSQGTLLVTVNTPATAQHGDIFYFKGALGAPYGTGAGGAAPSSILTELVAGAQRYAQANFGVTLSAADLSSMTTYASAQLAREVTAGEQALVASAGGNPLYFDTAQLVEDVAAYGASLEGVGVASGTHSTTGPAPPASCNAAILQPGASCSGGSGSAAVPSAGDSGVSPDDCADVPSFGIGPDGACDDPPPGGDTGDGTGGAGDTGAATGFTGSVDPNEKDGPAGVGAAHFTKAQNPFPYTIEFENQATASGAAQSVSVTDALDTTKLDLTTFSLGAISFGPYVVTPPPGLTSFNSAVDLRPTENVIVSLAAGLNASTGIVTWTFTSLDPATLQFVTDPTAGFLPPDTTPPAGIGHVAFTIKPLGSVADASTICNTATVVFDTNAPINTAQFCNTKDGTPPMSMVASLPATESSTSFPVSWSGSDNGSGVGSYTIYSNVDGGAFTPWLTASTATSGTFTGLAGHTYGFYSIATDLVGNVEPSKTQAEASTYIGVAAGSFSPASVLFPATLIGQSPSVAVTLMSNGAMPLIITGFTLSDTADFSETDTCIAASPLAVGQSCTVTVTFSPTASASLTAAIAGILSVTSNAPTPPTPLALSGSVDLPQSVWLAYSNGTEGRFANSGANATPAAGLTGGGSGIAIDNAGDVWSGAPGGTSATEFSKSGALLGVFTGGGIASPTALAISGSGYVWIANANNTLSLLQPNGTAVSSSSGLSGEPLSTPSGIAIDASGNVWVSNAADSSLTQFLGAADPVVTPLVKAVTNSSLGAKP